MAVKVKRKTFVITSQKQLGWNLISPHSRRQKLGLQRRSDFEENVTFEKLVLIGCLSNSYCAMCDNWAPSFCEESIERRLGTARGAGEGAVGIRRPFGN